MIKKLFTLLVAVWVSCTLSATSVDRQQATQLARDFIAKNFKSSAARRAPRLFPSPVWRQVSHWSMPSM